MVALWFAALYAPCSITGMGDGYQFGPQAGVWTGWVLFERGWVGPLAANFAWYANPLLLGIVGVLMWGRVPGRVFSAFALILALTAIWPGSLMHQTYSGPADWLWLACFALSAAVASAAKRPAR